ncbi:MAG: hypothetical protein SZ59_C0002G0011 [candidate division TM6 bacterium GW2011_GWF2_28_16]|nr:MAG: hypothetical protein SZ59_C0002G0011 [candidate division TM6 bacterium GW2011_GWF2_28_16]
MKQIIKNKVFILNFLKKIHESKIIFPIVLSWVFALSSQVYINLPFNFVPITLQTFAIFLCTVLFGRSAFYASILLVLQGIFGLPVFFGFGSGLYHLFGPTGGYLVGFVLATLFLSFFNFNKKNIFINLVILFLGLFILHVMGILWLSFFVNISYKVLLFLFVDIVKILVILLFV